MSSGLIPYFPQERMETLVMNVQIFWPDFRRSGGSRNRIPEMTRTRGSCRVLTWGMIAFLGVLSVAVSANAQDKQPGNTTSKPPSQKADSSKKDQKEEKKPARPPAYLTPEEAGIDFLLQGEYRGWQRSLGSERSSRSVGLQVVALGDDQFIAAKFYDGLPGAGWIDRQRFEYTGTKLQDIVRLVGPDYTIEVNGTFGVIYTREGVRVGELRKIHRVSPTMGATPPPGAVVLFDGTDQGKLVKPKITPEGLLAEGTQTAEPYGDMRLHAEFMLPFKPKGRGQDRGNSGFYIQGRYEVQVLDSFGRVAEFNDCGALYRTKTPDINMCLPPLQWQTYDIDFTMPRFDANGNKISDMEITVWHNGVLIHNRAKIPNKTGAGIKEGPEPLPMKLQDHANPVRYRNIWLIPKTPDMVASSDWVKLPLSGPPTPLSASPDPGLLTFLPDGSVSIHAVRN